MRDRCPGTLGAESSVALSTVGTATFVTGANASPHAAVVTATYGALDALLGGVTVAYGRFLTAEETAGEDAVVVISNNLARELAGRQVADQCPAHLAAARRKALDDCRSVGGGRESADIRRHPAVRFGECGDVAAAVRDVGLDLQCRRDRSDRRRCSFVLPALKTCSTSSIASRHGQTSRIPGGGKTSRSR